MRERLIAAIACSTRTRTCDICRFASFSAAVSSAFGACIAAKKLGRTVNKDIWCLSIDGNPVTLDLIEKDETTATLGAYPRLMGYRSEHTWTEVWLDVLRYDAGKQMIEESHVSLSSAGAHLNPVVQRYAWPSELDL